MTLINQQMALLIPILFTSVIYQLLAGTSFNIYQVNGSLMSWENKRKRVWIKLWKLDKSFAIYVRWYAVCYLQQLDSSVFVHYKVTWVPKTHKNPIFCEFNCMVHWIRKLYLALNLHQFLILQFYKVNTRKQKHHFLLIYTVTYIWKSSLYVINLIVPTTNLFQSIVKYKKLFRSKSQNVITLSMDFPEITLLYFLVWSNHEFFVC